MRSSRGDSCLFVFVIAAVLSSGSLVRADERAEVPDAKSVEESRKTIRELFKQEYSRSRSWGALAAKLLKQAGETQSDPPARFALLEEARDLAAKANDAATAVKAADELTSQFRIARGKVWAEIAGPILNAAKSPVAARDCAFLLLTATDYAVAEDDWKSALVLCRNAVAAARKARNVALLKNAQKRARRVAKLKSESGKVELHRATLKSKPDDPAANLAVGRYLCLYKLNWDAGLPLLRKGGDAALKSAAKQDAQAKSGDAKVKLAAADAWYALSRKAGNDESPALQFRAHHWYQAALPMLKSLQKIKASKRIAELEPKVAGLGGAAATTKWTAIRRQIARKKYRKWKIVGAAFARKTYEEIPPGGAILIGFRYTTIRGGRYPGFVQAIYKTAAGEAFGQAYGKPERGAKLETVKAKPGYAVGAVYTRGGGGFDAFKPIFMRIRGDGLDVKDKYDGPHVGGQGGSSGTLGGEGQFIIGLHGKLGRNGNMQAISPVTLSPDGDNGNAKSATKRGKTRRPIRSKRR